MGRVSAEIAGDITVAWLNIHARENVIIPDESAVAEFYKNIYKTIDDCTASRPSKSRVRPKPEGF